MHKILNTFKQFGREEDGAAMVEYSILLGLIAAATILAVLAIGGWVQGRFNGLCDNLNKVAGTSCVKGTGVGT